MEGGDATHVRHIPTSSPPSPRSTLEYARPVADVPDAADGNGATKPQARDPGPARLSDRLLAWVDRRRRWLFVGLLAVYLAGFNAQWRLEPDSALYLSIGRNLAEGKGYTFQGKAHRMAYPGLPVLFSGVFRAIPTRSLVPSLILMLLLGLATLGLVYRLVLLYACRATAVMVMLGVGMSRLFYRYSFELLSDLPFLFGVVAFLAGYEAIFHRRQSERGDSRDGDGAGAGAVRRARWFDWLFLVAGLVIAITTRPSMWALVLAVLAGLVWSMLRRSVRLGQVLICLAVVGAVALFYLRDPRHAAPSGAPTGTTYVEEDQLFQVRPDRTLTMAGRAVHNVPMVFDRILGKATFGMALGFPLGFLINGALIVVGAALVRKRPVWGMFILATLAIVLIVPKPQERYFLPILPLLVLAWWRVLRWVNYRLPAKWANPAFLVLLALGVVPNATQVVAFVAEQRSVPFLKHYKEGRFASVYEAAEMIRRHTPPSGEPYHPDTTWVFTPTKFARIITFLSGRYATEPDETTQLRPENDDAWIHVYSLEPSDAGPRDPDERRMTLAEWLGPRGFEVSPNVIAEVRNKDPSAKQPTWALHRVRPILLGERIQIIERVWSQERAEREKAERERAEREKAKQDGAASPSSATTGPAAPAPGSPP